MATEFGSAACRWEAPNTLGQAAMFASVGLLQNVGMSQVESLVAANSRVLSDGLAGIPGVVLVRPFDPLRVSGIVSFRTHKVDHIALQQALKQRALTCTVRGGAFRHNHHSSIELFIYLIH